MADKSLLEQMLERLVNDDQAKAEELFHEYVVAKSREIYEGLIESELQDEEVDEAAEEDEDEDQVEESADEDEDDEEKMDEEFEDIAIEADDEMGGDPTDDLEAELDAEGGDEEDLSDKEPAELFQDLDAIVDELQAKFDAMGGEGDMGGEEGEMKDAFDPELETVREYVEKVGNGHGAEKKGQGEGQYSGTGSQSDKVSVNSKSIVAGKNDMGGTTANILSSKEDAPSFAGAGGTIKGSSLSGQKAKEDNAGNINVPGGKAGSAFSKKEPGHGAEKKGEAEGKFSGAGGSAGKTDTASLFRGRR